jgi:hypothetical protein
MAENPTSEADRHVEDIVYVASQQLRPGEDEATLEMRETDDGQLAVMVYSSLDTLVAGAGPAQPWIAVPRERVEELVRHSGADGVLLDTVIPPGLRRGDEKGPQ